MYHLPEFEDTSLTGNRIDAVPVWQWTGECAFGIEASDTNWDESRPPPVLYLTSDQLVHRFRFRVSTGSRSRLLVEEHHIDNTDFKVSYIHPTGYRFYQARCKYERGIVWTVSPGPWEVILISLTDPANPGLLKLKFDDGKRNRQEYMVVKGIDFDERSGRVCLVISSQEDSVLIVETV